MSFYVFVLPVIRVALDVGYDSEAGFIRAFKREFGSPPALFRKTAHAEAASVGAGAR